MASTVDAYLANVLELKRTRCPAGVIIYDRDNCFRAGNNKTHEALPGNGACHEKPGKAFAKAVEPPTPRLFPPKRRPRAGPILTKNRPLSWSTVLYRPAIDEKMTGLRTLEPEWPVVQGVSNMRLRRTAA